MGIFKQSVGFVLLLTVLQGAPVLGAAPLRVMVKPPLGSIDSVQLRERETCASQVLSLYLQDWLSAAPEAALMNEAQAQAVYGSLMSPAWTQGARDLHLAVGSVTPVDAVVDWEWKGDTLSLKAHLKGRVEKKEVAWAETSATPKALKDVTDFLAGALGVSADSSPLAKGFPVDAPGLTLNFYLSQRMRADWINNSGVMQLDALQPYLKRLPKDAWTAAAIVRSGAALSTDTRAVPNPPGMIMMVQQALPCILGTPFEPLALDFCRLNRLKSDTIEKDLLGMIAKLAQDDVEAALEAGDKADALEAPLQAGGAADAVMQMLGGPKTAAQQAGAIRCLGILQSKAALPLLAAIAKVKEPGLKQATAEALGSYGAPQGDATLKILAADADVKIAFLASWSLHRHGLKQEDLAARAAACLKADPDCLAAVTALAVTGTAGDVPVLARYIDHAATAFRETAVRGLLRLDALSGEALARALKDPDSLVVRAALGGLKAESVKSLEKPLTALLANHPDQALAEAARLRLAALAPADPLARRRFELGMEHPYWRRKIIEMLVSEPAPANLALLAEAAGNPDPHTRAYAVWRLAEKDPVLAHQAVRPLLADPHRWVRLHAAAVAARTAGAEDVAVLKQALSGEKDEATRLYLEDALARAEGRAVPAPRSPVNKVRADITQVFLCGHGDDSPDTPIQGYYDLYYKPDEPARKSSAAGKIFLARANMTAKNPAQVFLNGGWRDGFWLGLDEDFKDLAALDGIVLGEESMYFRTWNEWANGWRLFCKEAGLDPERVAGDKEKLSEAEKKAWWYWEQRVAIEGFNAMYDWIKLGYGKRKPGFQVCTFMPDQNGPCEFDRMWKFDIGAGYYYETDNRHRYTQIRRLRTLWPDRPVLWLVDGNPTSGADAPMNYKYKPLTSPLHNSRTPPFADALCAWMAGAQPGYFYAKLAIHKDMKPGPSASGQWLFLENMGLGNPVIEKALDNMFRGVDEVYRTESEMKKTHAEQSTRDFSVVEKEVDIPELEDKDPAKDPFTVRMTNEREIMRQGLFLEKRVVWDATRLMADLPRLPESNDVLLVEDERAQAGALRLPARYDFLDNLNKLAGADLSRYRLIAVAGAEKFLLRDETLAAVTAWLKGTPGLLVVRGWLPVDNAMEAATPSDLDGRLRNDWPWETDVEGTNKATRVIGKAAVDLGNGLVFWQGAGFKGGVVFEQSDLAPEALRKALNSLMAEKKIGTDLEGPIGMEYAAWKAGAAAVSGRKGPVGEFPLAGLDLFTGIRNPVLSADRKGAVVADGFTGTHSASWNGVAILADQPLRAVKAVEGGLEFECDGLVQAAAMKGDVAVAIDGKPPVVVATNAVLKWVLETQDPGLARVVRDDTQTVILVRSPGTITLQGK